jgi:hypothetical protein
MISVPYSNDCEDYNLLGCDAVQSDRKYINSEVEHAASICIAEEAAVGEVLG